MTNLEGTRGPGREQEMCAQAALEYAARGWRVLPVTPRGKVPLISDWTREATTDLGTIRRWFGGDANVGIATGAESGLMALDIDTVAGGEDSISALLEAHGDLPDTVVARTGSGGWHIYFKHPGGIVRNSAGKLGRGLDIRGDGGFVVAPPSIHANGSAYRWEAGYSPADRPLAQPPRWLMEKINAPAPQRRTPTGDTWIDLLERGLGEGSRNDGLTRLAGVLVSKLQPQLALGLLQIVNVSCCKPPLDPKEVDTIAQSIARKELRKLEATRAFVARSRGARHG